MMGHMVVRGMRVLLLTGLSGYCGIASGMPARAAATITAGSYACGVVARDGYTLTYPAHWRCVNVPIPDASSAAGRVRSYVLGVAPDRSVVFGAFVVDGSKRDQAVVDEEQGVLDGLLSDITPPRRTTGWLRGRRFINSSEMGTPHGAAAQDLRYAMVTATTAHGRTYFFIGQADGRKQAHLRDEGLTLQHLLSSIRIA